MIDNDDFKKTCQRANAVENKRLTLIMANFENAKKIVAVDMKKSQAGFRRRLKTYRDRQREIMLSRASVPPSIATIGEFLLHRLSSRRTNQTPTSIKKSLHSKPSKEESLPKEDHASEYIQRTDDQGKTGTARIKSFPENNSSKTKVVTNRKEFKDSSLPKDPDQLKLKREFNTPNVRNEFSPNEDKIIEMNTGQKPSSNGIEKNIVTTGHKSIRPKTSPSVRISFQESSQGKLAPIDEDKSDSKYLDGSHTVSNEIHSPKASDPRLSENLNSQDRDLERVQDEYEADMELGRMAKRQRSKVDLRPCTAWARLADYRENTDLKDDSTRSFHQKQPEIIRNPFENMRGSLGSSSRQVRFFDVDEVEERGSFYNLLLQNRLKREQTRFGDLSAKVNTFCKDAEDIRKTPARKPKEDSVQRLINEARRVNSRASSFVNDAK